MSRSTPQVYSWLTHPATASSHSQTCPRNTGKHDGGSQGCSSGPSIFCARFSSAVPFSALSRARYPAWTSLPGSGNGRVTMTAHPSRPILAWRRRCRAHWPRST